MKKLLFSIVSIIIMATSAFAQTTDSLQISKPLSELQRDSVILSIKESITYLAENDQTRQIIGRYKVYPTENIYTSLKLDTATGEVKALQIGLNKDSNRMEYLISERLITWGETITGRFELYPTKNIYNFILLDTITGIALQIQWSTKSENRGSWVIH